MPSLKYTKEILEPIIKRCLTWSDVCKQLNIVPSSGSQTYLRKKSKLFNISNSHFKSTSKKGLPAMKKNDALVYCFSGSTIISHRLKLRLIRDGYKENKCEKCGQDSIWNGEKMSLILDHINGIHDDCRLENLRILCPNCSATLPTHGLGVKGLNKKPLKRSECSSGLIAVAITVLKPYII